MSECVEEDELKMIKDDAETEIDPHTVAVVVIERTWFPK